MIKKFGSGDFPDKFEIDIEEIQVGLSNRGRKRKNWNCSICNNTFNTFRLMQAHKFTVHGKVLRWCKPCGESFDTDRQLKAHQKDYSLKKLPC